MLDATSYKSQLQRLQKTLTHNLIEREDAANLALLSVLSGEHLLLLGPPGTAKSMIAQRVHKIVKGVSYFERLLTKFTVPEELFGPLSIKGLENDRYERLIDAYLPTAGFAFLDEIFKANSAILNALLTLINERQFDNGSRRIATPLLSLVGASNEMPEGEELAALYDRFLLRLWVGPVSSEGFQHLLNAESAADFAVDEAEQLTPEMLRSFQQASEHISIPDSILQLLAELRLWCVANEIYVSDRRWRKAVHLLRISALSNERSEINIWDCWLLQHCLWNTPEQHEQLYDWYAQKVGAHSIEGTTFPHNLVKVIATLEADFQRLASMKSQEMNEYGELLFDVDSEIFSKAELLQIVSESDEPRYLAPETFKNRTNNAKGFTVRELERSFHNHFDYSYTIDHYVRDPKNRLTIEAIEAVATPRIEPARQARTFIHLRLAQIDAHKKEVTNFEQGLLRHIEALETEIGSHLWIDNDFMEVAKNGALKTQEMIQNLTRRLNTLIDNYTSLPTLPALKPKPEEPPSPEDS